MVPFKKHEFFTLIEPNLPDLFSSMVSASRNPRNLRRGHKAFLLCFPDALTLRSVTVSSSFVCVRQRIKVRYFAQGAV